MRANTVLAGFASVVVLAACREESFPGFQVMGAFELTARPVAVAGACTNSEFDGGLSFGGTFSQDTTTGAAWFTFNGGSVSRPGSFDGRDYSSVAVAERQLASCDGGTVDLTETMIIALLSQSQAQAYRAQFPDGGTCPENALDGGIPAPDPDAGIFAPAPTTDGFDALLACGLLLENVQPKTGPACGPCDFAYVVEGIRQ
jgi:hypothetical protein